MEFGEKLQCLRKRKGLTQEELAESLYVSRTAISKWESGRGYPSIDSIKEIACFFSVTIDELLSSEKILSLAEKEHKQSIGKIIGVIFGILDLFSLALVVLPLYPNTVDGHVYSVSLTNFTGISPSAVIIYWIMFLALTLLGALKTIMTQLKIHRGEKYVAWSSLGLGILAVLFLILTRQVYATIICFALLTIKGTLHLKLGKA